MKMGIRFLKELCERVSSGVGIRGPRYREPDPRRRQILKLDELTEARLSEVIKFWAQCTGFLRVARIPPEVPGHLTGCSEPSGETATLAQNQPPVAVTAIGYTYELADAMLRHFPLLPIRILYEEGDSRDSRSSVFNSDLCVPRIRPACRKTSNV